METFIDLYEFLRTYENESILGWLREPWLGKDKQESLLRLFAGLKLITKLSTHTLCKGNFNLETITAHESVKDVFYTHKHKRIYLKDTGDSSDLTYMQDKHLIITTSKNLNKLNINKLDIEKILANFRQYEVLGYTMTLCICIRDKASFKRMLTKVKPTNQLLLDLIKDCIVLDWKTLDNAYKLFKQCFNDITIEELINGTKKLLSLKMHQYLGVYKTLKIKQETKNKRMLWGHIQRSGKSYIIAGTIIKDSRNYEKCNYLIITTAPNETIEQYVSVCSALQLRDFNIIVLGISKQKPVIKDKNIVICSKQFLQLKLDNSKTQTKSIKWLKDMKFEMRFLDESHNGGTTELAQKTLDFYGASAFTVQITATYSKPVNDYKIPIEAWLLWDLEDVRLCKSLLTNYETSLTRLIEKHDTIIKRVINRYNLKGIVHEYQKYPDLWILTDTITENSVKEIQEATRSNDYGWSLESCFLLCQGYDADNKTVTYTEKFQNNDNVLRLFYKIFGKRDKYGISDPIYPDKNVFMKRIELICNNAHINSRFNFTDPDTDPIVIMAFLPQKNINKVSKTLVKLLNKHKVLPEYVIVSINSKTTKDPKQAIINGTIQAKNTDKRGVLVLSGRQCSLGVSIDNCDIVLLLNNSMSFDMIYQMMFRSMTEAPGKTCGFIQ